MLNIIRDEAQHLSPHFFDFIVVDESHRSIYNTFGEVLDYFKTITLGLTATPTDIIDHNTFQLFHCEDGIPTFAYTYEEAVNNVPTWQRPSLCAYRTASEARRPGYGSRAGGLSRAARGTMEARQGPDARTAGEGGSCAARQRDRLSDR